MWRFGRRLLRAFVLVPLLIALAAAEKPRVLVSTDIGGSDNDDFQSLVHLLVYADLFDIEGLISSQTGAGRTTHIEEVLNAYQADFNTLQTYGSYPTPAALLALTRQGATAAGAPETAEALRGQGTSSPWQTTMIPARSGSWCGGQSPM